MEDLSTFLQSLASGTAAPLGEHDIEDYAEHFVKEFAVKGLTYPQAKNISWCLHTLVHKLDEELSRNSLYEVSEEGKQITFYEKDAY